MRRRALLCALLLGAAAPAYAPGQHNVVLPPDWEARFVRFGTVDQADRGIVRHLHVNPEALAAARPGTKLPDGTVLVMADAFARRATDGTLLRDARGRFVVEPGWIAISVQEKRPGWGALYPNTKRNGTWEYARFQGDGRRGTGSVEACFACHLTLRSGQDFAFDFWDHVQRGR